MKLIVEKAGSLQGDIDVPGDKSISHRAALLGALAKGTTRIRGFLKSEDCLATIRCLKALGVEITEGESGELLVRGEGLYGLSQPHEFLDCGGSGTTMRLLAGILSGQPFASTLVGNAALMRRPMQRVIEPLRRMGASINGQDGDKFPPLYIRGRPLVGVEYSLPVASAQVKSAILLAGLYAKGPTVIHEPAPTRDHTERMLAAMGANVRVEGLEVSVQPGDAPDLLKPLDITVPGDISSAAYFIVGACLIPGSRLRLRDIGVNPTRTGLLDVLWEMGAQITLENERMLYGEPVADIVVQASELRAVCVGGELVPRMIDEFPILAVAATQAIGTTAIRDAAELRVKETDRIAATVAELRRLGAQIEERPDGFIVTGPSPLRGAEVNAHNDHRLGMSLAIAGLLAEGKTILEGAEHIADSFPGFAGKLSMVIPGSTVISNLSD